MVKDFFVHFRKFWTGDVSFVALFVLMSFTIFFMPVLLNHYEWSITLLRVLYLVIFFIGIWSSKNPKWVLLATILFCLHLVIKIVHVFSNYEVFYIIEKFSASINLIAFISINLSNMFRDQQYNVYRIFGAVNVYLLVALLGASLLESIQILFGAALGGDIFLYGDERDFGNYVYFSMTNLTTVGFGDIVPVNAPAKMLSVFLSAVGILFPAVIIARLVSVGFSK